MTVTAREAGGFRAKTSLEVACCGTGAICVGETLLIEADVFFDIAKLPKFALAIFFAFFEG
jgi:hypothetical protein